MNIERYKNLLEQLLRFVYCSVMQNILYLFKLFAFLAFGSIAALAIGRDLLHTLVSRTIDVVLFGLLFFMGISTGQIPDIEQQLALMGLQALVATILVITGCVLVSLLVSPLLKKISGDSYQRVKESGSWKRFKTPLLLIGVVLLGLAATLYTDWFNWFDDGLISILLYVLLFLVGMQLVQNRVNLVPLLRSPLMLAVPFITITGTWLGALALPLFFPYTISESMALVSGFGWYSLSGILLSDLGDPGLGTVSFLSNLFRESASFILIPTFAAMGLGAHYSVSIAGATSMDVTLPLIKKSYSDTVVPLAIIHGFIMTLVAPLFITLWY